MTVNKCKPVNAPQGQEFTDDVHAWEWVSAIFGDVRGVNYRSMYSVPPLFGEPYIADPNLEMPAGHLPALVVPAVAVEALAESAISKACMVGGVFRAALEAGGVIVVWYDPPDSVQQVQSLGVQRYLSAEAVEIDSCSSYEWRPITSMHDELWWVAYWTAPVGTIPNPQSLCAIIALQRSSDGTFGEPAIRLFDGKPRGALSAVTKLGAGAGAGAVSPPAQSISQPIYSAPR